MKFARGKKNVGKKRRLSDCHVSLERGGGKVAALPGRGRRPRPGRHARVPGARAHPGRHLGPVAAVARRGPAREQSLVRKRTCFF